MAEAASAINKAAFLPGDFNFDDRVDARDYVMWRKSINDSEKYALWRGGYGAAFPFAAESSMRSDALEVPEPGILALGIFAFFYGLLRRRSLQRTEGNTALFVSCEAGTSRTR